MKELLGWNNQKTGEIEYLQSIPDDRWPEFIPQDEAAQNLYNLYVEHKNMTPEEAAIAVLELVLGKA
jgi:hypothetical protein